MYQYNTSVYVNPLKINNKIIITNIIIKKKKKCLKLQI